VANGSSARRLLLWHVRNQTGANTIPPIWRQPDLVQQTSIERENSQAIDYQMLLACGILDLVAFRGFGRATGFAPDKAKGICDYAAPPVIIAAYSRLANSPS
jgi:hypothetical protein